MANGEDMPNEHVPGGGRRADTETRRRCLPLLATIALAVVVFGDALRRCLAGTAQLARETADLAVLARTDPLTALHNRRHMEEHLRGALSAARRHRHPLAVLFIDIDSFKGINDTWGYEAGDDVLRTVGNRVRLALRTEDLVGRWGGEEFLVVLPATDLSGAVQVAERVRDAIASRPTTVNDRDIAVTVSIGCASGVDQQDELVREATRALRQAKRAGKNCVVAADPPAE